MKRPTAGVRQPKPVIGSTADPSEHEADRLAARVLGATGPTSALPVVGAVPAALRRSAPTSSAVERHAPPIVGGVLGTPGTPLDSGTRSYFEPRFGQDFSRVRLHSDAQATESARAVGARAYTVGDNIVLPPSQPSARPSALLAHELAHVAQQAGSPDRPVLRRNPGPDPTPKPPGSNFSPAQVQLLQEARAALKPEGDAIVGMLIAEDGRKFPLKSGGGQGFSSHVEGKATAKMVELGITKATLLVELEPCQICDRSTYSADTGPEGGMHSTQTGKAMPLQTSKINTALPPGTRLTVVGPESTGVYEGVKASAAAAPPKAAPKAVPPKAAAPKAPAKVAPPTAPPKVAPPKIAPKVAPPKVPAGKAGGSSGMGGAGVQVGAAVVGAIVGLIAQKYMQDILDEKNAEAFQRDLVGQQERIATLITQEEPTAAALQAKGSQPFINITLKVRYQTDISGDYGGVTAYMGMDVHSVQVSANKIDKVKVDYASSSAGSFAKEQLLGSSARLISFSLSYPELQMVSKEDPPPAKGSGCFIATACYGSPDAREVLVLRLFRDEVLRSSSAGRVFITVYYRTSPPVAALIGKHPRLRAAVRTLVVAPLAAAVSGRRHIAPGSEE